MRAQARAAAAVVFGAVLLGGTVRAEGADDPFASCREALAQRPDDYDSAFCFYQTALAARLWDAAASALAPLIAEQPSNQWLPLTLGHVYRGRDNARAEALYRRAAAAFRAAGHDEGEVIARVSLRDLLMPLGRIGEADREIERVAALAASSRDPLLRARAWTAQANQLQDAGRDLGQAYGLLKQAEATLFPSGPYRLKRTLLSALGSVAFRLGRFDEALTIFDRLDALAAAANEPRLRANAQYNRLNTIGTRETLLPTPGARQRLIALAEQVLTTAAAAQSDDLVAKSHRVLAELLAADDATGAQALDHARRCAALAARLRLAHDEAVCAWVEAAMAGGDAARRAAAEARATEATARAHSPRTDAFSAGRRMRLSWDTRLPDAALRDGLAALDTIERLRGLQDEASSSAELFSAWTLDYYWLAGRLLERSAGNDVAQAFSIAERMRGRALLERLGHGRVASPASSIPAGADAIARVQRRLLDPNLAQAERTRLLEELEVHEREARESRRRAAVTDGRPAPSASFAALADVQAALRDDEALLSFHVGLWRTYEEQFGGGSWLVAATRRQWAVFRLPDRAELAAMVPVYTGLLLRGDALDAAGSVRLHELLLAPALRWLGPGVTRLVVVPDGVLHQLPFDALRASARDEPLATRYELVSVPSASVWRTWRLGRAVPRPGVLALADPSLATRVRGEASSRNATLAAGLELGPLPYARREARAIAAHLAAVDVIEGDAATERAMKTRDLQPYGLIHFAAHAVADDARPERSAVLLAPGSADEDGLLQAREIEALDLEGRVVVLSACQTAAGVVQSGEGVLSLARAFFAAGARDVVASRWPIRDDDAAAFFDSFYRHLATRLPIAAALRRAKADAIRAGRPPAAWAGLVLLGSGDQSFAPAPAGGMRWSDRVTLVAALLALAVAARRTIQRRFARGLRQRPGGIR